MILLLTLLKPALGAQVTGKSCVKVELLESQMYPITRFKVDNHLAMWKKYHKSRLKGFSLCFSISFLLVLHGSKCKHTGLHK